MRILRSIFRNYLTADVSISDFLVVAELVLHVQNLKVMAECVAEVTACSLHKSAFHW